MTFKLSESGPVERVVRPFVLSLFAVTGASSLVSCGDDFSSSGETGETGETESEIEDETDGSGDFARIGIRSNELSGQALKDHLESVCVSDVEVGGLICECTLKTRSFIKETVTIVGQETIILEPEIDVEFCEFKIPFHNDFDAFNPYGTEDQIGYGFVYRDGSGETGLRSSISDGEGINPYSTGEWTTLEYADSFRESHSEIRERIGQIFILTSF